MVFETYTEETDIIFKPIDAPENMKHTTPRGRIYGGYFIDAYMLKLIKTGLNTLKYNKIPSTPQDGEDYKLALDLVSKAFDELTEV